MATVGSIRMGGPQGTQPLEQVQCATRVVEFTTSTPTEPCARGRGRGGSQVGSSLSARKMSEARSHHWKRVDHPTSSSTFVPHCGEEDGCKFPHHCHSLGEAAGDSLTCPVVDWSDLRPSVGSEVGVSSVGKISGNFKDVQFYPIMKFGLFWAAL